VKCHFTTYDMHFLHLPYERPIKWSGHLEAGIDVLLLVLKTDSGMTGIAETPVRLKWNSASIRSFRAVLEDVVLPVLVGVDVLDSVATNTRLSTVREHPLAKSLVDVACWDLRSGAARIPLWKALGAGSASVPVSVTLTRAEPKNMATQAASAVEKFGIKAFKVKTGQGIELDTTALREIRHAVGPDAELFADSNSGYRPDEVGHMSKVLSDFGVLYFEDPCPLLPTKRFGDLVASCARPILVDDGCRSLRDARLFIDAGAQALSAKVMKTGLTDSLAIAREAEQAGVKVAIGISATSSLGAIASLSLANSLPASVQRIPCEETFFLIAGSYLHEDLRLIDGRIELPVTAGVEELIDWKRVESLQL
jgi:L-Ala-D/L-Glu epimerase